MDPTHAVLSEYVDDVWRRRMVSGAALAEVERWLAGIEARPRLPGPVSGKPLAWLHLTVESGSGHMRTLRRLGLLTDVRRALDRDLHDDDMQALVSIFDRQASPFAGTLDP